MSKLRLISILHQYAGHLDRTYSDPANLLTMNNRQGFNSEVEHIYSGQGSALLEVTQEPREEIIYLEREKVWIVMPELEKTSICFGLVNPLMMMKKH
jgi:hypothetical protein